MMLRGKTLLVSVVLLITAAALASACGESRKKQASPTPPTATTGITPTTPTTPTPDVPPPTPAKNRCSALSLDVELPDEPGLPAPVAATRRELYNAARACDYDALQVIIDRHANRKKFGYTYGVTGAATASRYWRSIDARERTLDRLARVLTTPESKYREAGIYTWPSANAEQPSADDFAALVKSGAYTNADVQGFRRAKLYLGYRVGIRADGTWVYYQRGD